MAIKNAGQYVDSVRYTRTWRHRVSALLPLFSLLVIIVVFWWLKLTGITLAGDAFCGYAEHIHDEECTETILICTVETSDTDEVRYGCELDEHIHTSGVCSERSLTCREEHEHTDDCFSDISICRNTEHTHSSECIFSDTAEQHIHSESCYRISYICNHEEHVHTSSCYSDLTADLESAADWEITLPYLEPELSVLEHIVDIARSQLGYTESERNFIVDFDNVRYGYTRYGEWYGNPYGDWSVMFTSFCLRYAGLTDVPIGSGADAMRLSWEADGRYRSNGTYTPLAGDIVFLDKNDTGTSDTTAIITYVNSDALFVIEGDLNDQVTETVYNIHDVSIVGYGLSSPEYSLIVLEDGILYSDTEFESDVPAETEAWLESDAPAETEAWLESDAPAETEAWLESDAPAKTEAWLESDTPAETEAWLESDAQFEIGVMLESEITVSEDSPYNGDFSAESSDQPVLFSTGLSNSIKIAQTTAFDHALFTDTNSFVVYTIGENGYYAFDGNGEAVQIIIDDEGNITANTDNPDILLWTFTLSGGETSYLIRNVSTGRYMHAYPNNGSGVTTAGAYTSTLISDGNDIKIRSNSEYAMLNESAGVFVMTQHQSQAAAYQFGIVSRCAVWLDGTNGGLKSFSGSQDKCYIVESGDTIQLPYEWQSPAKYGYRLRGWYDVTNGVYYPPGDVITVTENLVFYADWIPATYDIGQFNASVADTVSTNHIISTHVFDYNSLFNVLSQNAAVTVNASGHTEVWSHVQDGTVSYGNNDSLDFVFIDNDASGKIAMASNRNTNNRYDANIAVKPGIYTDELGEVLFGTDNGFDPTNGTGIIGKTYLGAGDHLFQYMDDPNSEYYGYYYYDSELNAASYNQSEQRFYVYDYLERTSDSANASGAQKYSDFLPLNSPYANTAGKNTDFYTYDGEDGQYSGVTHFQYDVGHNSANTISTNMAFGMSMEMEFYLPDVPGSVDANGAFGNKDLYGNEMSYQFSGDDDVWVLVDGQVVLDIGGIHGVESGEINFSTGIVTVNGEQTGTLYDLASGEHTLTVYYLERGSSQSNCAMYFNLAPRFSLTIQKEDVLTQELLDGAEFSVYTDPDCTVPAELWERENDYEAGFSSTNVFTVQNGHAYMWGLSPGKTYYIKETGPPAADGYNRAEGIICLTFDIKGQATFETEIVPEDGSSEISGGYTVYDYRIDTENQTAYITVTNAQEWVKDITTVQAVKIWNDAENHSDDYVTVYLTITDPDGTVRRIREAVLGEENGWTYTWTNLPKYASDGVTEINYGVEESYTPGYSSSIQRVDRIVIENAIWEEAYTFVDGEKYLLKTSNGYLSAASASSQTLMWADENTAKALYDDEYSLCAWTASVSGSSVKLTNNNGQVLSFNNGNNSSSRYFFVTKSSTGYQSFVFSESGSGIKMYYRRSRNYYYIGSLNSSGYASSVNSGSGLVFTPMILRTETTEMEVSDIAYTITNTPLDSETSLKVTKHWDTGLAVNVPYETEQVTIRLYADGKDTGRTVTLSLKNNWTDTFRGLPYTDDYGNEIVYSIEEVWSSEDWEPLYGEVVRVDGDIPTYEAAVTNVYKYGHGYELPSTGSSGQTVWILSGLTIMLSSLVLGYILRRKSERRAGK